MTLINKWFNYLNNEYCIIIIRVHCYLQNVGYILYTNCPATQHSIQHDLFNCTSCVIHVPNMFHSISKVKNKCITLFLHLNSKNDVHLSIIFSIVVKSYVIYSSFYIYKNYLSCVPGCDKRLYHTYDYISKML